MEVAERDAILAWHILDETKCLRYGDGRTVKVGETLSYDGWLAMNLCQRGMHVSKRLADAARNFPTGHYYVTRVAVWGTVWCIEGFGPANPDKMCAEHRQCLGIARCTEVLARALKRSLPYVEGYGFLNLCVTHPELVEEIALELTKPKWKAA